MLAKKILYIHVFVYIVILVAFKNNFLFYYMFSFSLILFLSFLYYYELDQNGMRLRAKRQEVFYIFFVIYLIIASQIITHYPKSIAVLSLIMAYSILFRISKVNVLLLVKVSNVLYVLYLLLSLLAYADIIPYPKDELSIEFVMSEDVKHIPFTNLSSFVGYSSGSQADIDSFSIFVFFINLIFYKNKINFLMILLTLMAAFSATTSTPYAALFLVFIVWIIVRGKKTAFFILMSFSSMFIAILYFLATKVSFEINDISFYTLMTLATNGRSIIWDEMINKMLDFYTYDMYLFGNPFFQHNMTVYVPWTEFPVFNPHNSLLRIFFEFPLLFILFYIYLNFTIIKNYNKKMFLIVMVILILSLSNQGIFSVDNPIYIFWIAYSIANRDVSSKKIRSIGEKNMFYFKSSKLATV